MLPLLRGSSARLETRALPDNHVNPFYLEDLKKRGSVARIAGKLYAFDDLH